MKDFSDAMTPVFGAIIRYTCDPGYELNGAASIICTENDWSAPEPTCRILECPFCSNAVGSTNQTDIMFQ